MINGHVENLSVYIDGRPLDPKPSQKLFNHSPDGFNWGYRGSGPAQLALAVLLCYVEKDIALRHHQDFKEDVIAKLNGNKDFELSGDTVKEWIKDHISSTVDA